MSKYYKNIFLDDKGENVSYTSKKRGPSFNIPVRNRVEHGERLLNQLKKVSEDSSASAE